MIIAQNMILDMNEDGKLIKIELSSVKLNDVKLVSKK